MVLLGMLLLSACQQTPTVLKIGLVAPFEGETREVGYDAIYAARLAVREFNAGHPLRDSYRLALVALDDSGDLEISRDAGLSLIADEGIIAVIGYQDAALDPLYFDQGLTYLRLGSSQYRPVDPETLSIAYRQRYEAVTPFEETAGPYAGPTAASMQTIIDLIEQSAAQNGSIDRASLLETLNHNDQ